MVATLRPARRRYPLARRARSQLRCGVGRARRWAGRTW